MATAPAMRIVKPRLAMAAAAMIGAVILLEESELAAGGVPPLAMAAGLSLLSGALILLVCLLTLTAARHPGPKQR